MKRLWLLVPAGIVGYLPHLVRPGPKRHGFVLGLDAGGRVVHNLRIRRGPSPW